MLIFDLLNLWLCELSLENILFYIHSLKNVGLTRSPLFLIHTRNLNSKNGGWPSYPPFLTLISSPSIKLYNSTSSSQPPPLVSWEEGVTYQLPSVKILVNTSCRHPMSWYVLFYLLVVCCQVSTIRECIMDKPCPSSLESIMRGVTVKLPGLFAQGTVLTSHR